MTALIDHIEKLANANRLETLKITKCIKDRVRRKSSNEQSDRLKTAQDLARSAFRQVTGIGTHQWGSWVPGIALAYSLIRYPVTIVDLTPLNNQTLLRQMDIRSDQFIRLVEEGFLKVNIVHYDSQKPTLFSGYLTEDGILPQLLSNEKVHQARGLYINAVMREPVLSFLAGKSVDLKKLSAEAQTNFGQAAKNFSEVCAQPSRLKPAWQGAIFRGAAPSIFKIGFNYAYLQCAAAYMDRTDDQVFDMILSDHVDGAELARNPDLFARFAERLETSHKLITAPLTGAYGGTYGMDLEDSKKLSSVLREQDKGFEAWSHPGRILENTVRDKWFQILKDMASGRLDRFAKKIGAGPGHISRLVYAKKPAEMTDLEFDHFINFLHHNRSILEQNSAEILKYMEEVFDPEQEISANKMTDFLRASNEYHNEQASLFGRKYRKSDDAVFNIIDDIKDAADKVMDLMPDLGVWGDPVLSLNIKMLKLLSRRTDFLTRTADQEVISEMKPVVRKFGDAPRLIVDQHHKWQM